MIAGQVDDVQAELLGELLLEREGLGEVEPGLEEQDRDVGPDLDGHVDDARPLALEGRGHGDALEPGAGERPLEDLLGRGVLEPFVQLDQLFVR